MREPKPNILLVEDDLNLGYVIKDNLAHSGYNVQHIADGEEGWKVFSNYHFQLCILDVMLPHKDGFSLAEQIRKVNKEVPILFLTAKSMKEDRIQGFLSGGDDYITKPFSIEELLMRINVFLKRSSINLGELPDQVTVGDTEFDYKNLSLTLNGKTKVLTQKECDVLKYFISRKNEVVSRSEILNEVWGEADYFLGRSLDVFISRLRKYLKDDSKIEIVNLHGVGFKLLVKEN